MESTIIYVPFYEKKFPKTFANYSGVTPYYGT